MERPPTPSRLNPGLLLIASVRRQFGSLHCTALFLGLCIFLPVVVLCSSSRRPSLSHRATAQLFEISRRARLVQSFESDPLASVPQIWEQRLGASAALERWTHHGRGLWWLIWLDDGEPVLVLSDASDPSSLDLLFADELHRSSFDQRPPLLNRALSALEQSCLERLTSGAAVHWRPSGLASLSGPLFPALTSVSHGCLQVTLQGDRLMAEGPVASKPFASLQDAPLRGHADPVRLDRSSAYLELNSVALQPLLDSFVTNALIAEQLDSRYGLPQELRDALLAAPVALRVDALEAGRFQASAQVRLMLAADQSDRIRQSLDSVATALLQRGFKREQRPLLTSEAGTSTRVAEVWLDSQRHPSGGWSLGPEDQGRVELLFALGAAPKPGPFSLRRLGQQRLRLRGRPDQLARLGWLGPGWPRGIRAASQLELEMTALPKQHQPGWLRLQLELR